MFNCGRKKEIRKYDFVTRNKNKLLINLQNGKTIIYNDFFGNEGFLSNTFREYIEDINSIIIVEHRQEGLDLFLINRKTGASIKLIDTPLVISTNKKRIISIGTDGPFLRGGLQIIEVENDYFKDIFQIGSSTINAKWLDNHTIESTCLCSNRTWGQEQDPECYIFTMRIKEINKEWFVEE